MHFVKKAKYIEEYKIQMTFEDKKTKIVDLKNYLDGEIFEPLNDINYFKNFKVALNTITWKNGADISPDFLYEILLKSGFPLTSPVEHLTLGGQSICSIAGGALLISLERKLTLDAIRAMADKKPERVVCLDEGFAGNDQLKTNAVQTFKSKGIVFRTV